VVEAQPVVLADLLRRRAREDSQRLAFAHGDARLTFGDLAERAELRARALRGRGVTRGDRLVIAMSTGLPLVEVFWAAELLGAAPCVVNPFVPAPTLEQRIALVRPQLVITDELASEMGSSRQSLPEDGPGPDDLAFLQLTSGTSGVPRVSMILHRNVMAYLRTNRSDGWFNREDVFVSWAPPWHDLGLVRFIVGPLYHGVPCHMIEPAVRTIPEWLTTISAVGGTYSAAPDFAFRLAVRMVDPAKIDLSPLRFMKSGGEPVRQPTIDAFETRFGAPGVLVPGYGLGEATLGVSEHLPGEEIPVDPRGNVSCGPLNDGLEVRAGTGPERPDEILVRGDAVFNGYFDAPDETARTLRDGWLHTGDSGYLDAAGRLFVLGRREGMIKRAGAVIAPRELEEAAQLVPGIRVAAATMVRDGDSDAVVVAVEASEERSAEQVAAAVSRSIVAALGFAPTRVVSLPRRAIPRTENGKIRHGRLRALLEDGSG
jgi:acyl-CoA synthetase (AMP-forming)/AMP-acid ligase II